MFVVLELFINIYQNEKIITKYIYPIKKNISAIIYKIFIKNKVICL